MTNKDHLPLGFEVKRLNWQIFCSRSFNRSCETSLGEYVIQNENGVWRLYLPHKEDPHSEYESAELAEAAAQADFERRVRECVVAKLVDVATVREDVLGQVKKIAFDISEGGEYHGEASVDSASSIYQQGAFEVYEAIIAMKGQQHDRHG